MTKKKMNMGAIIPWVLAIVAIGALAGVYTGTFSVGGDGTGGDGTGGDGTEGQYSLCPDDGDSSVSVVIYNRANTTGSETITETVYVLDDEGNIVSSITDTDSAPTAVTLNCGEKVILKPISTSGAAGDSSFFYGATVNGGIIELVDGNIELTPTKGTTRVTVQAEQHDVGVVRVYDYKQSGWMYDSGDSDNTVYEGDGTTFTSTTNNATATDESIGLDFGIHLAATGSDTNVNDRGILVLVEAPTATWDVPVLKLDGVRLDEVTAQLTAEEKVAYVDYEYVYLIPKDVMIRDGAEEVELRLVMSLKSGQSSASADPQVDLAPRGQSLATSGTGIVFGAVTDASTPAQVHTLFDITFDVT